MMNNSKGVACFRMGFVLCLFDLRALLQALSGCLGMHLGRIQTGLTPVRIALH